MCKISILNPITFNTIISLRLQIIFHVQEYLEQDAKQMKAKMDTENKGIDILYPKIKWH